MNISMFLQMAAEAVPERIALNCQGAEYSYGELWSAAQRAAGHFRSTDASFVAMLDETSAAAPIAMMGAAIAGIPYVPLNFRLSKDALEHQLARIAPAVLIANEANYDLFAQYEGISALRRDDFLAICTNGEPEEIEAAGDPASIAVQLFTSGTTGTPKAAILRHEHLVSYILGSVEFLSSAEEEAALISVPPYHIAGISALMSSIYSGRRMVVLPSFSPQAWLDQAQEQGVTNAFVVPTMLSRVIECIGAGEASADLPALKALAYGGGKMPAAIIQRALELFPGVNFTNAYGLTETSSTITLLDPEDHRRAAASDDPVVRRRLGSVGRALPSVEIEIRGEDGELLGAGEPGEIYVRGPQVSGEYRGRSALDAEGWFPTRDHGEIDPAGYLYLSGRADDVIVRGGENISPSEIEDVLLSHPMVVDVAAVAAPSEEWGEAVGIAVVARDDQQPDFDELKHLVKSQLRSSRVPEAVKYVPELPYNETGKLLRRVIKEWFT